MENNNNKKSSNSGLLIAVLCLIIGLLVGTFFLPGKINVTDQQGAALESKQADTLFGSYDSKVDSKKYELNLEQSEKLNNTLSDVFLKFAKDNNLFEITSDPLEWRYMCFLFGNGGQTFVYYSNTYLAYLAGNCIHISYY